MSVIADVLRELHRIHRQRTDLQNRLKRGPKQVAACESRFQQLESELALSKERLTKTRMTADEKQLQLKSRENRIEDLKLKLNSCSSNKEYQTLKEQIAADQQANSVLADEILELLEKLDQAQADSDQIAERMTTANEELQTISQQVSEQTQQLEAELDRVHQELQRVEADLPGDFKPDYQRVSKARGEDALAQVEGECCGNCYQTLSPQVFNNLYLSKPVFCSSCGSLLYLPEDRSPTPK